MSGSGTWIRIGSRAWNVLVVAAASVASVVAPLRLVLDIDPGWPYLGVVLVFAADVLVHQIQLRGLYGRAYEHERDALGRYRAASLVVDLAAAVPYALLPVSPFWALLHLAKLFRVGRAFRVVKMHQVRHAYTLTLAFFGFWLALSAHFLACGWMKLGQIGIEPDPVSDYIRALYWVVTTLTTVGYGDVTPSTDLQRIYTMVVQILGVGVYGYVIGNVAGLLTRRDPVRAQYLENMERLSALVQYRRLPAGLQNRIRDYYTYLWRNRLGYDEATFLEGLPGDLKTEVALHLKQDVVEAIPLFRDAGEAFTRDVALHLEPLVLTPGAYVCKAGDVGTEMYFVIKGRLTVLGDDGERPIAGLNEGDFFGEIALFMTTTRTATVRADTYCDLYRLEQEAFHRIMARYPDVSARLEEEARLRHERHRSEI